MRRLLRIAWYVNTTLMVLSGLSICGMIFEVIFMTDFVVENQTTETVWITPIGAKGDDGARVPLPITLMGPPLHFPAFQYGDFRLLPGEELTIHYDWDDVNLAEIVIRDSRGRWTQIVVDPHPQADRYHAPRQRRFDVANLAQLPEASKEAREAVANSRGRSSRSGFIYLLLFGPWVLSGLIGAAMRRWGKPPAPEAPESTDPCTDPAFRGK